MSYDLYFCDPSGSIDSESFASYFESRRNYQVANDQAVYENPDTGVYFTFDFEEAEDDDLFEDEEKPEGCEDGFRIIFILNYARPHFFGFEAAREVRAFIEAFGLHIYVPQTEVMGFGPFSVEGFLRSWNAGNLYGIRTYMQYSQEYGSQICPTAVLDRVWRWNYRRGPLQDKLGESIFVPKIMFMKGPQFVRTALVWPDACPILLPKTDTLFIFRKELAESLDEEDEPEIIEVEWSKFEPLITHFRTMRYVAATNLTMTMLHQRFRNWYAL